MKRSDLFSRACASSLSVTLSLGYAVINGYVNVLILLHNDHVLQFTTQFFHVQSSEFYA